MAMDANIGVALCKVNAGLGLNARKIMLENIERLRALQLKADGELLEATRKASEALGKADDVSGLIACQNQIVKDQLALQSQYWRDMFATISESQAALFDSLKDLSNQWQKSCAEAIGQGSLPSSQEMPLQNWIKSMTDAATATFDSVSNATRQAVETANVNLMASHADAIKSGNSKRATGR
ncbi:MAG: phasin family protein [Burkholderiales bacterium]|nr:phasin family protein [Burkholderiales bacterium]MDE2289702.1 phasin family protein [Burkholderiales bacterium]